MRKREIANILDMPTCTCRAKKRKMFDPRMLVEHTYVLFDLVVYICNFRIIPCTFFRINGFQTAATSTVM